MSNKKIFLILLLCNYVLIANDINDGSYILKSLEGYSLNSFYKKKYPNSNGIIKIKNDNNGSKLYTYEENKIFNFNDILEELSAVENSKNKEDDNFNIYINLDGIYFIQHKLTGLFLTTSKNEETILLKPWNSEENQKWSLKKIDETPSINRNYLLKATIDANEYSFISGQEGLFITKKNKDFISDFLSFIPTGINLFYIRIIKNGYSIETNRQGIGLSSSFYLDQQKFEVIPEVIEDRLLYNIKSNQNGKYLSYDSSYFRIRTDKSKNVLNWEFLPIDKYQLPQNFKNKQYYLKNAFSNLYLDVYTGEGVEINDANVIENFPNGRKTKVKIIPSEKDYWVYIGIISSDNEVSSYISYTNHNRIVIENDKSKVNKFLIEMTSPETFVLLTEKKINSHSVDIYGSQIIGKVNDLVTNKINYYESQQFQLIDVDSGNPFLFKPDHDLTDSN